jgi:hypothetical protein
MDSTTMQRWTCAAGGTSLQKLLISTWEICIWCHHQPQTNGERQTFFPRRGQVSFLVEKVICAPSYKKIGGRQVTIICIWLAALSFIWHTPRNQTLNVLGAVYTYPNQQTNRRTICCNSDTLVPASKNLLHATGRCRHQIAEEEFISKLFWKWKRTSTFFIVIYWRHLCL